MARVVTPSDSTLSRVFGSLKRAIPHTSLLVARDLTKGKAIWPAGPVIRIFLSLSMVQSYHVKGLLVLRHGDLRSDDVPEMRMQ